MNKNDAVETMGKILPDEIPVGARDAVHVAVIAATAGETLWAMGDVSYENGIACTEGKHIGIVDPFLDGKVKRGQKFWLFLYPRTVTGLKHVWEHPDVAGVEDDELPTPVKKARSEADVTAARDKAEKYLRQWADEARINYSQMMEDISTEIDADGNIREGYILLTDLSSSESIEDPDTFWKSVGLILNKNIKNPPNYFSCSC